MRVTIKDKHNKFDVYEGLKKYLGKTGEVKHSFVSAVNKVKMLTVEFDDGSCSCWVLEMCDPVNSDPIKTKETTMKNNNKHPHHDLIVELISDTSKQVEMVTGSNSVIHVETSNVVADKKGSYIFRIKPREFIKGHWYPCLDKRIGLFNVLIYGGHYFHSNSGLKGAEFSPDMFEKIGKSIGKIEFWGGE